MPNITIPFRLDPHIKSHSILASISLNKKYDLYVSIYGIYIYIYIYISENPKHSREDSDRDGKLYH